MIAEVYGKISSTGSNLSERLEDQLTGDVFGTLRYIDYKYGLIPILMESYYISKREERKYLKFKEPNVKKIRFWPWIIEAEPDLIIEMKENSHEPIIIQVEVKYYSGLSSDDSPADNVEISDKMEIKEQTINTSRNQIVRQIRSLKKAYPGHRRIQIYLTTDVVYPKELLSRVQIKLENEDLKATELYWLSWHDIPSILKKFYKYFCGRENIIVSDLLMLLEKKGFARFSILQLPIVSAPKSIKFNCSHPFKRLCSLIKKKEISLPKLIPSSLNISLPKISQKHLSLYKELTDGE